MALKTDLKRVVKLAEVGAELCASVLTGVVPMLILFAQSLIFLSLIAAALIGLRIALIALAPSLARSSKVVAAAINVFMDVFAYLIETFKLAIYAIELAVEALSFGAYRPKAIKQALQFPKPISATEVVTFSNIVAQKCPSIDSIGSVFRFLMPQIFHSTFCPILRATKPIYGVGATTHALLGWGVQGGFQTWPGENCMELEPLYPTSTCVFIAVGILIAEFFLPILLIGIVLKSSGAVITRFLVAVTENLITVLEIGFVVIEFLVKLMNMAPKDAPKQNVPEAKEPLIAPPEPSKTAMSVF